MKSLIKLEWQKLGMSQYIKYALLCTVLIYTASAAMAVISVMEGEMMFENYQMYVEFYQMILRIVYQIFGAVLLVRLVIDEYANKTIDIMFTYPVSRKKLLAAKMLLAGTFIFTGMALSSVVYALFTWGVQGILHMYEGSAALSELVAGLPGSLLAAFMAVGMSFIPLYFGMKKKSGSTVIVTAVLLSLLLNGTISGSGNSSSLFGFMVVPAGLSLLGILIGYISWRNINKADM